MKYCFIALSNRVSILLYVVMSLSTISGFAQINQARPTGIRDGINYLPNGNVVLSLFAPYKNSVHVIGDFNNWTSNAAYQLKRDAVDQNNVYWWIELTGLNPANEYAFQYLVDGSLRIADPYTEKILDPNADKFIGSTTYPNLKQYPVGQSEIASIIFPKSNDYTFLHTNGFVRPKKEALTIYELCVRDFLVDHTFAALLDKIPHFKELGVNTIELMPISEFDNNSSWGYNPTFYFAVDKYYGPAKDVKRFIDECHKQGLAVIIDLVLNHSYNPSPLVRLYQEGGKPAANNPWFNRECVSNYCWENDFNHTSKATQYFVDRITEHWLSNYHFDGIRFDFTQGFTQVAGNNWAYDSERVKIIKRLSDKIWGLDPAAYVILEHWTENKEESELADYGCMLWGNATEAFHHAGMGDNTKSDFSQHYYGSRGWKNPHLVTYIESHDEERTMYKSLTEGKKANNYNIQDLPIALKRSELCAAFLFTTPGPKMMWQFQELGYDYSIDYNGRVGEKPVRWDYKEEPQRKALFNKFSKILNLRSTNEVFTSSKTVVNLDVSNTNGLKKMTLQHTSMNAVVIGNFGVVAQEITSVFPTSGAWYDCFGSNDIQNGNASTRITLQPGEYSVYTSKDINGDQIHAQMTVTGSFVGWDLSANPMTYIGNHQWKVSGVALKAGENTLKFANSTDWTGADWGNNNGLTGTAKVTTGGGNNIVFTLANAGLYTVSFNEETLTYSIIKDVLTSNTDRVSFHNEFDLFPNPSTNNEVSIKKNGNLVIEKIEVLNAQMQLIETNYPTSNHAITTLGIESKGLHFLMVKHNKGETMLKVVVE